MQQVCHRFPEADALKRAPPGVSALRDRGTFYNRITCHFARLIVGTSDSPPGGAGCVCGNRMICKWPTVEVRIVLHGMSGHVSPIPTMQPTYEGAARRLARVL